MSHAMRLDTEGTDRHGWTFQLPAREVLAILTVTLSRYAQQVEQERLLLEAMRPQLEKQARSKGVSARGAKQQLRAVRAWAHNVDEVSKTLLGWKHFLGYADPEQPMSLSYNDYEFFALTTCQPLANWVQINEDDQEACEEEEDLF